ncbi:MAG TPA: aldehyde dehydrogenase (NADP(+)) [Blastocatellia bacterium]|nr:aldehyde dehydrogenase (NADP(+)) [Blastocatellia bacterium]
MTKELTGRSIIGSRRGEDQIHSLQGFNPATGEKLLPVYYSASVAEVDLAAQLAHQAFASYSRKSGREKAAFLRKIAENIEAIGQPLVDRATLETGLPAARIQSETGRTWSQLRLFADLVEEGSWVDARIDRAIPDRKPLPKPDIRSMLRPIGPVVVFCASNFPLAFSVAGGDTASALAAGCPVIVKAHHAHPGTAELVGLAITEAVKTCDLPEGVFSLLYGSGNEVGMALVKHPLVKAGGFTGSRAGGLALMNACASRPEPIPFYAEMSSINPVFILPGAMKAKRDEIATGLHASVTLGAGQFCTNPGLVLMADDSEAINFATRLGQLMSESPEFVMLTEGISSAYRKGVTSKLNASNMKALSQQTIRGDSTCKTAAALFMTDAESFLKTPELSEEVFGPSTLLVTHSDREQMLSIARNLEGHLTATIQGTEEDLKEYSDLIAILETKVGRLLFNGFPTGVEVCHSMVHGGPFPATSDGRSTSVGTRAIFRFTRQFCYQGFPDSQLPDELKNDNPLGILRIVDGRMNIDRV